MFQVMSTIFRTACKREFDTVFHLEGMDLDTALNFVN